MSSEFNENNYSVKMDKTIQSFKKEISTLRTGRANSTMLDMIKVDVYGQIMPINQLATISVPEARLITVQVWDKSNVALIDSSIQKSDLGINPQTEGSLIRLPLPQLTEERRAEFLKLAGKISENSKVAIRNIRRDGIEKIKSLEKNKEIGQDDSKKFQNEIEVITSKYIKEIEDNLKSKEEDLKKI